MDDEIGTCVATAAIKATLFLAFVAVCCALSACQQQQPVGERAEGLGPHVHRLTVDLAGAEPAEARLTKVASAVCPAGYDRQGDEAMPPDAPTYQVWLVRCR